MIFWDTSALIRCYEPTDPGHARAKNLLLRETGHKACSLLRIEAVSGIVRRFSKNKAVRAKLLGLLEEHLRHFDLIPMDERLVELGTKLVQKHRLRAGDALHLAAAVRLARELGRRRLQFASADDEQADAAEAEGIRIFRLSR